MYGNVAMGQRVSNSSTGVSEHVWNVFGEVVVDGVDFIRLGLVDEGDRWEASPTGESDLVKWWAGPMDDKSRGTGLKVRVVGKKAGDAEIPLRYIPQHAEPQDVGLRVYVKAAPPPLPPPVLTVEGETFKASVSDNERFHVRLKTPLPRGHRWEVKEAVFHYPYTDNGDKWRPIEVVADENDAGLFFASTRGDAARIVFVEKSDGWLLFPDTVTLLLEVDPTPKC